MTSNSLIQHLKGQLPEEIAQLTQLKEIDIRHNLLTGDRLWVYNRPSASNLTLPGTIPTGLLQLTVLKEL